MGVFLFFLALAVPAAANFDAAVKKAQDLESKKKYEEALEAWGEAIDEARDLDPEFRRVRKFNSLRSRALLLERMEDFEGAANDLEFALRLQPGHRSTLKYWHYLTRRAKGEEIDPPVKMKFRFEATPASKSKRRRFKRGRPGLEGHIVQKGRSFGPDGSSFDVPKGWKAAPARHLAKLDFNVQHSLTRGNHRLEIASWEEIGPVKPMIQALRSRNRKWGFRTTKPKMKRFANGLEVHWVFSLQSVGRRKTNQLHVLEAFAKLGENVYFLNILSPAAGTTAKGFRRVSGPVLAALGTWASPESE